MTQPAAPKPSKHVEVAIAIVFDRAHQHVLICLRKHDTVLPGYWEFPGGKCDLNEPPPDCAVREIREEVAITIRPTHSLPIIEHDYPYAHVRLHPFVCDHIAGDVQHLAVADARWVLPQEVLAYRFPEANHALMRQVSSGYATLIANATPLPPARP